MKWNKRRKKNNYLVEAIIDKIPIIFTLTNNVHIRGHEL